MEWMKFVSHELFMFVSFLSGVLLGYIVAKREDNY